MAAHRRSVWWMRPSLRIEPASAAIESAPTNPPNSGLRHSPNNGLVRLRKRVALPGNGPRSLALVRSTLFVANFFSDDLCRIDLSQPDPASVIPLDQFAGPRSSAKAKCSSTMPNCVSRGGRVAPVVMTLMRGLTRSIRTCSTTASRIRRTPALLMRINPVPRWRWEFGPMRNLQSGRAFITSFLTEQPRGRECDRCLPKILRPVPSPHLVKGKLNALATQGQRLFKASDTGCIDCHPPPLFTDSKAHDVGTATVYRSLYKMSGADSRASDRFYSPILLELWRTAPGNLHDGSAPTLREVLTTKNQGDHHGHTSHLTPNEIDALVEYLLSL